MLNIFLCLLLLLTCSCYLSCSDDPTSTNDNDTDTNEIGTMTDIDGNTYQTIKIGDQWWMAENLEVTHYHNGEAIPNVTDDTAWESLITGAWCSYNNDDGNVETYGRLYNWYVINDSRGLTPEGWHVASDVEWQTLVDYLGGSIVASDKMKTTGTIEEGDGLWYSSNIGATNESGFSALPGGCRFYGSAFTSISVLTTFWSSSTGYDSGSAWTRSLDYSTSVVYRNNYGKRLGCSVRCVKD
jgi:uncharacterized protein (TIGR02145 family)